MSKFRRWYLTYQNEITWFIIGWMTVSGFDNLVRGNLGYAAGDLALAYFNYYMWKTQL